MGTAEERPSRIPGAVVWQRTPMGPGRILPDGCMDVIHMDGRLVVAGPDTVAHLAAPPPGQRLTAIRFAPGTAAGILGVPADELRDLRVPLDDLWGGKRARRLAERLADAPDRGAALEAALLGMGEPAEDWIGFATARLRGGAPVAAVASEVGFSERQLHRRSLTVFGYGLKTLSRILRLNRALDLARGGMTFGVVAATSGYADQAHLAREVKALAGAPLTEVLR
ncbi:helix-turn-helix domain-containing protein [Dactylosporangium sucinum]|uniref:AraC family transcriptional regulator n=1 Tax=Dactylosporangium sucinum TaxID=1424081 RepID=A0A917WM50_9ACTN|nr:helix-turn-helix domain-containing protein [Dactylosporangium sucinum]GGM15651.1 AraC family transcriptional regulator [Dactylosporangium sucinum]